MDNELFRKKSVEKIKSPDNLDELIRVSNPGVWLLLISVIVLLTGMCLWGIWGRIDSTLETTVYVENETVICYVSQENATSVKPGMTVKFGEYEATLSELLEKEGDNYYFTIQMQDAPSNGLYEGKIVISTMKPISFVLN